MHLTHPEFRFSFPSKKTFPETSTINQMMQNLTGLGQFPELRIYPLGHGKYLYEIIRPPDGSVRKKKKFYFRTVGQNLSWNEIETLRRNLFLRSIDGIPDEKFWRHHP